MNFGAELLKQQREIDDLIEQVERLRIERSNNYDAGDWIDYAFNDRIVFSEGENTAQNIVFTVPERETMFVADRLSFFVGRRFVSTDPATDGPDELRFQPSAFTWSPRAGGAASPLANSVDAFVEISETYYKNGSPINRSYQNMPMPTETFFCGGVNVGGFQYPTGLIFPCPFLLTGGSSMTLRIAPSFAANRNDPPTSEQNEYEIRAILEGRKVVRT